MIGTLPVGLPAFYWPGGLSFDQLGALLLPAFLVTLVSFLETASSAKVDNARAGKLWNENQDLIGQGLGKIASGLTGAFPTSSSFSRSAITLYAGAKTQWATLFSVAVVAAALLWAMPLLYHVPQAVLAAIVATATIGLLRPSAFVALWRVSRIEAAHRAGDLRADHRDRAVDLLGRAGRPARGAGALHVPPPAPAHHRSRPAPGRQPARPPPVAAAAARAAICMRCAWTPSSTSPRPARWSARSPSRWPSARGSRTCACSRSRSTASTSPAPRCSAASAGCWSRRACGCTSRGSSCRRSRCSTAPGCWRPGRCCSATAPTARRWRRSPTRAGLSRQPQSFTGPRRLLIAERWLLPSSRRCLEP